MSWLPKSKQAFPQYEEEKTKVLKRTQLPSSMDGVSIHVPDQLACRIKPPRFEVRKPDSTQVKAWKSYPKDHAPPKVRPMSIASPTTGADGR